MAHDLDAGHFQAPLSAAGFVKLEIDIFGKGQTLLLCGPAAEIGKAVLQQTLAHRGDGEVCIAAAQLALQQVEAQSPDHLLLAHPPDALASGDGLLLGELEVEAGQRKFRGFCRSGIRPVDLINRQVIAAGGDAQRPAAPPGGQLDQPAVQVAAGMERHRVVFRLQHLLDFT